MAASPGPIPDDDADLDEVHQLHCLFCYNLNCTEKISCVVSECPNACGTRFHRCKLQEHELLCPLQKSPCINSIHGCPRIVLNKERGVHLETCPASVIRCTMEWNRWPVYTDERKLYSSLVRLPVRVNCAQLDMALAMRDQRMLNRARKVPRRMKRVLRNSLTKRYPAVPIQYVRSGGVSEDEESTATSTFSDDEDTMWDLAAMPPGLQRSVCSKLLLAAQQKRLSKATIEEVSPFSSLEDLAEPVKVISELNGSVTCHYSVHSTGDCDVDSDSEMTAANANPNNTTSDNSVMYVYNGADKDLKNAKKDFAVANSHTVLCDLLDVDLHLESISRYQTKPRSMYTFLCAQEFRRDEYAWHSRNVHTDIHCGLNGWLEQRCPLAQYGCTYSSRRVHPNHKQGRVVHSKLMESFGVKPCGNDPSNLKKSPSVDTYSDDLKKKAKPKGQFYSLPDIWPKSRENTPDVNTSCSYESHVEILDRGRSVSPPKYEKQEFSLTDLPFEILRGLVRYLDGFSLKCLSLTCHLLRDICCSIVEERGIVVCEWQRYHVTEKRPAPPGGDVKNDVDGAVGRTIARWRQSHKRWLFSNAFSPVEKWCLADNVPMSEHLKTCQFNEKLQHHNARLLPVMPGTKKSKPRHHNRNLDVFESTDGLYGVDFDDDDVEGIM